MPYIQEQKENTLGNTYSLLYKTNRERKISCTSVIFTTLLPLWALQESLFYNKGKILRRQILLCYSRSRTAGGLHMIWHLKALWVLTLLQDTCSTSFPEASGVYNGWTSRHDWFSAIIFHSSGYEEEVPILNKPLQSKVPIGPSSIPNGRAPEGRLITIPANLTVLTFPLRPLYELVLPTNSPIIKCSIK